MLKATFKSQYRNANGNLVFVSHVTGDAKDVADYIAEKGDNNRFAEDGKTPLHFTTRIMQKVRPLVKTQGTEEREPRWVEDNSEIEFAIAQANTIGGAVGDAIAKGIADKIASGFQAPASAPVPATTTANLG